METEREQEQPLNVLSFNNDAEMRAYLIQAATDALQNLHPLQSALTYGSFWCRFVDLDARVTEFGRVAEKHEVVELELTAGATGREAARTALQTAQAMENGYLYGIAYSVLEADGEWGHTHKGNVWPIEESLFHAAAEAKWQMDMLPISQKLNLQAAYTALRGHNRGA